MSNSGHKRRASAVPAKRISRLSGFGGMTANIVARSAFEGMRSLSKGQIPNAQELLFAPSNIGRVADELARMRGAALKLGQLLSLDTGELLPPELSNLFARLRAEADFMPAVQLNKTLEQEWGDDWQKQFSWFDQQPLAAASIGQVHKAARLDGQEIAIKVQYPGVAKSIDSDIKNIVALFRITGFAPARDKLDMLVTEAKRQLYEETDYAREAENMSVYYSNMQERSGFVIPSKIDELSSAKILAMTFVNGNSIECVEDESQSVRNSVFERLVRLALDEILTYQFAQTDPNFANYTYNSITDEIGILDFGAMRYFSTETIALYRQFLKAGLEGNRKLLRSLTLEVGLYSHSASPKHQNIIDRMVIRGVGAVRQYPDYDFGNETLLEEMRDIGMELASDNDYNDMPHADVLFLQRKVIGLYLLGRRLNATIPLRGILEEYTDDV